MKKDKQTNKIIAQVERAVAELRRGQLVDIEKTKFAIGSPENIDMDLVKDLSASKSWILISGKRASYLFSKKYETSVAIELNSANEKLIYKICGLDTDKLAPGISSELENNSKALESARCILKLAKIAELIPAVFLFEKSRKIKKYLKENDVVSIPENIIGKYEEAISLNLKQLPTTPIVLRDSKDSKLIPFRPEIGGKEHYAIVIGNPGNNPLVRIHSSCYTGDLLGSLRCDCRDQLHETIKFMGENGGGIIIYLVQEGRGIGLVNKLRAYDLQYKGYDTVEANEYLGFEDDERPFLAASSMLQKLGIKSIRLISNNPKKAEELEKLGIAVKEMLPIIIDPNEHNRCYIKTKSKKMRHKISI